MKYLIAGLGNIGPEYAATRHNIGFMVLDHMASISSTDFELGRHAFISQIKLKGRILVLIKPTTFMNLSGKAIQHWLSAEKIPEENLLVVTDDISLPFAKQRLKGKGSHGGHNGLRNIEETLGHRDYARLRFGVGNDFRSGQQVDYVLSPFSNEQQNDLGNNIEKSKEIIESFCTIGLERTMNLYN